MAAYRWVDGLVTCGLTACTLGSAPDQTLGNEYGRTLPFTSQLYLAIVASCYSWSSVRRRVSAFWSRPFTQQKRLMQSTSHWIGELENHVLDGDLDPPTGRTILGDAEKSTDYVNVVYLGLSDWTHLQWAFVQLAHAEDESILCCEGWQCGLFSNAL